MPHTSYDRVPQCPRRRSVHRSVQTINRVYGSVYGSVCDTVWLFLTMVGQPSNSQMQLDSMGTVKCSLSLSNSCHHILFSQSVQTINRMYGLWVRVHATQCGYFSATLLSLPLCRVLLLCLQACNLCPPAHLLIMLTRTRGGRVETRLRLWLRWRWWGRRQWRLWPRWLPPGLVCGLMVIVCALRASCLMPSWGQCSR